MAAAYVPTPWARAMAEACARMREDPELMAEYERWRRDRDEREGPAQGAGGRDGAREAA